MAVLTLLLAVFASVSGHAQSENSNVPKGRTVTPTAIKRTIDPDLLRTLGVLQADPELSLLFKEQTTPSRMGFETIFPVSQEVLDAINDILGNPSNSSETVYLTNVMTAWCHAEWTDDCSGVEAYSAPDGWKICKFNWIEKNKSHGDWATLYDGTKKQTAVRMDAHGTKNPFDRRGGWVDLTLAQVTLIDGTIDDSGWIAAGCSYQNVGGNLGQGGTEILSYCVADSSFPFGLQMCRDWTYDERGERAYGLPYPCGGCIRP